MTRKHPIYFTLISTLLMTSGLLVAPPSLARQGAPPKSLSLLPAAGTPAAGTALAKTLAVVPVMNLPAVDAAAELARDEYEAQIFTTEPLRYAVALGVDVTPASHGAWQTLEDGGRLWRLQLKSPGATDLNFGFDSFRLPPEATFYVLSQDLEYWEGPYAAFDNEKHHQLWSPPIPGESAILELYVPPGAEFEPELRLIHVGTGYRHLFEPSASTKQASCNVDVACSEADAWRDEIRSVAAYSLGGSRLCTGTLIRDVPGTFRPFFLTANHCGLTPANAASMVVFWNFESPQCGDLGDGPLEHTQTGATFLASRAGVDMALVELDDDPEPAFNVHWAGWDRSGMPPADGGVSIHHPRGDEKAISFDEDPVGSGNSCTGTGGFGTHWVVGDWELGTTEPGSSGAGLWDPATHRLVGFLSGGTASCNLTGSDCFGKFSAAWNVGFSASDRLRDWLDPEGTGVLTVDGSDAVPEILYHDHSGIDVCATMPQNENGVWEPGEIVEIAVSLISRGDFTGVTGVLTSPTPGVTILDGSAAWGSLASGSPVASPSSFVVQLDEAAVCLAEISFDLRVTAVGGAVFDLSFVHSIGNGVPIQDPPFTEPIPDEGSIMSTLEVTEDVVLSGLDVFVNLRHSYIGDVGLVLRSPAGTEVTLLDRPGVPASELGCSDDDLEITFDDDADGPDLESHCASTLPWFAGIASPAEPLAAFAGESILGTWTLIASDGAKGDRGQLFDWSLLPDPPAQAQCTVCVQSAMIFADGFESGDTTAWSARAP